VTIVFVDVDLLVCILVAVVLNPHVEQCQQLVQWECTVFEKGTISDCLPELAWFAAPFDSVCSPAPLVDAHSVEYRAVSGVV
jgi:hypothetical protein